MTRVAHFVLLLTLFPTIALGQSQSQPAAHDQHQGHDQPTSKTPAADAQDRSGQSLAASAAALPSFIPPLTDADRQAAFPDIEGHAVHDNVVNYFVLFDQLEFLQGSGRSALNWDNKGWVGKDRTRLWFRSEGARDDDGVEHAEAQVFYGRALRRWWDVLVGVRQDLRPGPARTWAAVGLQGLAPYWFEVEATAYFGAEGRTHFRFETEYELLLTNRLILQPLVEVDVYGRSDPGRGIGGGLSSADAGLRIRYEFRRELAPYVGITWDRKFFGTADLARAGGSRVSGARLATGLRLWL
jgi:copper resistance protein B